MDMQSFCDLWVDQSNFFIYLSKCPDGVAAIMQPCQHFGRTAATRVQNLFNENPGQGVDCTIHGPVAQLGRAPEQMVKLLSKREIRGSRVQNSTNENPVRPVFI